MTGEQLKTQFENIVDDSLDATHLWQLFSQAKNKIERDYNLLVCTEVDSSQTVSSGNTYTTMKNLPTGWRKTIKLFLDTVEYFPVPFVQRDRYRNTARRFYIKVKDLQYAICGNVSGTKTVNHYYIKKTDDFTEANKATDNVCTWPEEFQPLIPYEAAKIYQSSFDADEIAFRMSASNDREHKRLLDSLVAWDADLKLAEMNYAREYDSIHDELDGDTRLGLM